MTTTTRQPTRKDARQALRQRYGNLTDDQRQALVNRGMVATVDGRVLSVKNTILLHMQATGTAPSVVGGYRQWKEAGRQVRKGEHGSMIWIPAGTRDSDGELVDVARFLTAIVFDVSQTDPIEAT